MSKRSKNRKGKQKRHFALVVGKHWRITDWSIRTFEDPDIAELGSRRRRGVKRGQKA